MRKNKHKSDKREKVALEIIEECKQKFEVSGVLEEYTIKWILKELRDGTRYEEEVVGVGYDFSIYIRDTHKKYISSSYKTVGDFLEEPSNETYATYVSGHGIDTKSLKDILGEELNDLIFKFMESRLKVKHVYTDTIWDDLESVSDDWFRWYSYYGEEWLSHFCDRDFSTITKIVLFKKMISL